MKFDDGPYSYTSGLLDGLKKRGAHVTFFMVGASGSCGVSHWESLLPRMVEDGHQIANHTWSHVAPFGNLSPTRMKNEIDNVYPYLRRAMGGDFKQLVRIPGGDMSARTSATVNHPMIRFDFDTKDYLTNDANKVYNSIISQVKDGSIVCLHDRVGTSCTAPSYFYYTSKKSTLCNFLRKVRRQSLIGLMVDSMSKKEEQSDLCV